MRRARSLLTGLLALACAVALPGSAAAAPKTVWLCKPGKADNPCDVSLDTTRFSPSLKRLGVDRIRTPRRPRFDCFYVYPTVSDDKGPIADFSIDPELRSIALYQAARYSGVCRVFAPVYRQTTLEGILGISSPTPAQVELGYADVRAAWRRYLAKFNKGRGVVIIGHSQGTFRLRDLLAKEIDPKPRVRRRLISALLLGGNVLVKKGRDVGGDFKHIPACRKRTQTGCVVAFSAFNAAPPAGAFFGRTAAAGMEVLCTNPAALGGGSAKVTPISPTAPFAPGTTIGAVTTVVGIPTPAASTAWRGFPGSYRARCTSTGGASVLRVSPVGGAARLSPSPTPEWGLHLVDANIALGDQVDLVRAQAAAWRR
jgi:hypothetical protein